MGNSETKHILTGETVLKIVFDFINSGHEAGRKLERKSIIYYCDKLISRLKTNNTALDFSPTSFKRLDNFLIDYKENLIVMLSNEETAWLIRELASYIGETLLRNTNGTWIEDADSLYSTRIKYSDERILRKENKTQKINSVSYSPTDIAITNWQKVLDGKNPTTGKMYREIIRKYMVEEISD